MESRVATLARSRCTGIGEADFKGAEGRIENRGPDAVGRKDSDSVKVKHDRCDGGERERRLEERKRGMGWEARFFKQSKAGDHAQGSRPPKPEADFLATTLDENRHIHRCHLEPRLA